MLSHLDLYDKKSFCFSTLEGEVKHKGLPISCHLELAYSTYSIDNDNYYYLQFIK